MTGEFEGGRIKMTNFHNPTIDFTKRFSITKKYEEQLCVQYYDQAQCLEN